MILRRLYSAKWNRWEIYLLICLFVCFIIKNLKCRQTDYVPERLHKYLQFGENYTCRSSLDVRQLYDKVEQLNGRGREVLNRAQFGPVSVDTPVLAVQAARDPERLQYLVVSLAQVDGIGSVLLVFSHSFYDENVNRLVRSITFCKVLQIYFPYSMQLNPNVFPGPDLAENYANESEKDLLLYRERAAEKHHWWWTAHVMFEEAAWAGAHRGLVVFLEEDSYVLPDFMHMLRYGRASQDYVPEVQLLALGRPLARNLDRDKLTVDSWRPPYDKALAFNKTTWKTIKKLGVHFCTYDDASWSYSLLHAFEESQRGRAVMAACMAPRVISTGIFSSGRQALENIYPLTRSKGLFPSKVEAILLYGSEGRVHRRFRPAPGGGGFSDVRDRLLCRDPLSAAAAAEGDISTTPPVFPTQ